MMQKEIFLLLNLAVLPLFLLLGGLTPVTINCFWVISFILSILFLLPTFKESGALFLLSPCMLTYLYSIINYITGSLYYCTDILVNTRFYGDFFSIDKYHLFIILSYLNFCNAIVVVVAENCKIPYKRMSIHYESKKTSIIFLLSIFALLHVFVIGGGAMGDDRILYSRTGYNYPLIIGIIVLIVSELCTSILKKTVRYIWYGILVVVLGVDSVGSKRELFFALLAIIMVELIYYERKIKVSVKTFLAVICVFFLAAFYVLAASIVRGYGQYGAESLYDAVKYIPEYAQSDIFSEMVGNNFETPYHYATAVISCDYFLTGTTPLLYGETIAKTLFIPIPRSLFDYKPHKMNDIFTTAYDPFFRAAGGSYPVSVYSEFLQNFHVLSLFFVFLFMIIFQKLYVRSIVRIRDGDHNGLYYIPMFALFLSFSRGGGLEVLVIYSIMAWGIMWLTQKIIRVKKKVGGIRS